MSSVATGSGFRCLGVAAHLVRGNADEGEVDADRVPTVRSLPVGWWLLVLVVGVRLSGQAHHPHITTTTRSFGVLPRWHPHFVATQHLELNFVASRSIISKQHRRRASLHRRQHPSGMLLFLSRCCCVDLFPGTGCLVLRLNRPVRKVSTVSPRKLKDNLHASRTPLSAATFAPFDDFRDLSSFHSSYVQSLQPTDDASLCLILTTGYDRG